MTWQLTDKTIALVHRLYALERSRSWFGIRGRCRAITDLLGQVGENGEPAVIPAVARSLFSQSPEVRVTAAHVIARLLASVPPEELLHLDRVLGWSWGWYVSDAWSRLQPAQVESLIADLSIPIPILGLLSLHRNGYVRHEAVHRLAENRDGAELPYLLIRQNDWVEPISQDAQAAVKERLVDDYLPHFVQNVPLVVRLMNFQRRDHTAVVQEVIEMLVQPRHERLLLSTLESTNRIVRRWGYKHSLALKGAHQVWVIRCGVSSDDAIVRLWACRMVQDVLGGDEARSSLDRMTRDSSGAVRSEAFRRIARTSPEEARHIWRSALLDKRHTIREMARFELVRLGVTDVAPIYRTALASRPNSLTALLGIGETGDPSDLPMIRRYLTSPFPSRRSAAVRGLARIGGEAVTDELVQCLRDDNKQVTREAKRQLEDRDRTLDGNALLTIVNDDSRLHCRKEAIQLIFGMGKWRSLPWLISAAVHPDVETAKLAQHFIKAWFSPPLCNTVWTKPSRGEKEAIDAAVSQCRASLTSPFRRRVDDWLEPIYFDTGKGVANPVDGDH